MNKGIIIGIVIAIIIGISIISISNYSSYYTNEVSFDEEKDEVSFDEDIKNKPKQFTIELDESVGVSGG